MDQLPDEIRKSKVLTGNDLAMLAGVEAIPGASRAFTLDEKKHQEAKELLKNANVEEAWRILSMPD